MTVFYGNLQYLCYKRGITPSKMCLDLGIDKSNATNWKRGMVPRYDKVVAISEYFGVNQYDLLNKELFVEFPKNNLPIDDDALGSGLNLPQDDSLSITEEEKGLILAWRYAEENEKSAIAALFGKYGFKRTEEKRFNVKVG